MVFSYFLLFFQTASEANPKFFRVSVFYVFWMYWVVVKFIVCFGFSGRDLHVIWKDVESHFYILCALWVISFQVLWGVVGISRDCVFQVTFYFGLYFRVFGK